MAAIKLRAERRIGELLGELERAPEGRPQKLNHDGLVFSASEYRTALTDWHKMIISHSVMLTESAGFGGITAAVV